MKFQYMTECGNESSPTQCVNRGRPRLKLILAVVLLTALGAQSPVAQVHKYKDANGQWIFSDRPPPRQSKLPGGTGRANAAVKDPELDLRAELLKKHPPRTPVEKTSLSVVTVHTPMGHGSGFFVSEDGYLVTNKHVIRGSQTAQWKRTKEKVEAAEERFDDYDSKFKQAQRQRKQLLETIREYEQAIKEENSGLRRKTLQYELQRLKDHKRERDQEYNQARREFEQARRKFRAQKSDFDFKSSMARVASNFKIVLKDKRELQARLVRISDRFDLALLKLDGFKTPPVEFARSSGVGQGARVFVLGSPLNSRDYVTAGILTSRKEGNLVTDATINPGNSGGPLTDEQGRVIGVNTWKEMAGGYGIAIPAEALRAEFANAL